MDPTRPALVGETPEQTEWRTYQALTEVMQANAHLDTLLGLAFPAAPLSSTPASCAVSAPFASLARTQNTSTALPPSIVHILAQLQSSLDPLTLPQLHLPPSFPEPSAQPPYYSHLAPPPGRMPALPAPLAPLAGPQSAPAVPWVPLAGLQPAPPTPPAPPAGPWAAAPPRHEAPASTSASDELEGEPEDEDDEGGAAEFCSDTRWDERTPCRLCERTFPSKYQAKKHFMRLHYTGVKRHKCERCGTKAYAMKEDLTTHARACGRVFPCACGKQLRSRATLLRHCKQARHQPASLEGILLPDDSGAASAPSAHTPSVEGSPVPPALGTESLGEALEAVHLLWGRRETDAPEPSPAPPLADATDSELNALIGAARPPLLLRAMPPTSTEPMGAGPMRCGALGGGAGLGDALRHAALLDRRGGPERFLH